MDQVVGISHTHLIGAFVSVGHEVHPVLALNLLGNDGPGFGPANVPSTFVGGQDHTLTLPVDEIPGSSQTELSVLLVKASIG